MAIRKAPNRASTDIDPRAVEAFVNGTPDARVTPPPRAAKQNKVPVLVRFDPEMTARLDDKAARMGGLSRSAAVGLAVSLWLDSDQ